MRLSEHSRKVITATVAEVFGPQARVRLFGSRLDDAARGGDIDLIVELPAPSPNSRHKSLTCVALLQQRLGDQPIDLLVHEPSQVSDAVHRHALASGVLL